MARKTTKRDDDPLAIPTFLLVKNRPRDAPKIVIPPTTRVAGQKVSAENPEHVALRAAWGHPLPRGFDSWDWLREELRAKEEAREERRAAREAARAEMVSIQMLAERLGEKARDVKRALRRDPKTLPPEARKIASRFPRLAKTRHFDPADVTDVCVVVTAGLAVLREAGGVVRGGGTRRRRTGDGRTTFRTIVLELREERPDWRHLTRAKCLPALAGRWPALEAEQALAPADVPAAKALVRAMLGAPGAVPGASPAPAPPPQQRPAPPAAPRTSSGRSSGAKRGRGRRKK